MGVNYAEIEERYSWLSSEFGENMARKYFGDEAVDEMPRYVRGKRKGLLKGQIQWRKVERGGWVSREVGVERRVGKVIEAKLVIPVWGDDDELIYTWDLESREVSKCRKKERHEVNIPYHLGPFYEKKCVRLYPEEKVTAV